MTITFEVTNGEAYMLRPFHLEGKANKIFKILEQVAEAGKDLPDGIHTLNIEDND